MTKKADAPDTVFAVTVSVDLMKMGKTRRRGGYAFSRAPLYFSGVPAEVSTDPHLRIRQVAYAEGMEVVGPALDNIASPPALLAFEQVGELSKADMVAYAESHGVDPKGTKAEILERIEAHYREKGALAEAAE